MNGLNVYTTPLCIMISIIKSQLFVFRDRVLLNIIALGLLHFLLESFELVLLFVEKLFEHLLALPSEFLCLIHLLELHVLEEKYVQKQKQLLAVDTEGLTNLSDVMDLCQVLLVL